MVDPNDPQLHYNQQQHQYYDDSVFDSESASARRPSGLVHQTIAQASNVVAGHQDRPANLSVSSVGGLDPSDPSRYKKGILKPMPLMTSSPQPRPEVPPKPHFFKKSENRVPFSDASQAGGTQDEYFDQFKKVNDYRYMQNIGHVDDEVLEDEALHYQPYQQNPPTPTFAPHTTAMEKSVRPSIAVR